MCFVRGKLQKQITILKPEKNNMEEEKKVLSDFILNNTDLETLEEMLSDFNIFETLGLVNTEIRHSNMLAWLLDPKETHGLNSYFLNSFLKHFIDQNGSNSGISIFDIDNLNYVDVEIHRERENIDLLIIIKNNIKNIVVCIENKVYSGESKDQLKKYKDIIENEFSEEIKLFMFLTREGFDSSDNDTWGLFSYKTISTILDNILKYKTDVLNSTILTFINHYNLILKKHIMGDSEIEVICNQIYAKHKKALDLIFEKKNDEQKVIGDFLQKLIKKKENEITIDNCSKIFIRFSSKIIEIKVLEKTSGTKWTDSEKLVLFEFVNVKDKLNLKLVVGPSKKTEYKKMIFDDLKKGSTGNEKLFQLPKKNDGSWNSIYSIPILHKKDFENNDIEKLTEIITEKFDKFMAGDFITINNIFKNLDLESINK